MAAGNTLEQTDAAFRTTHWTMLDGLHSEDRAVRQAAAERVTEVYWPPVYACARRLVRSREAAADLTQGFFADVVLGRKLFERADAGRGTLRSLVRSALKRYATDQWRRAEVRGNATTFSLGELDYEDGLGIEGDVERVFDRRWALALFEEALRRTEAHFITTNKARHWRLFEARVLRPAIHRCTPASLAKDTARHGFGSTAEGAAATQTVKRRFDMIFREVVAETVGSDQRVEEEYRVVRSLLSREELKRPKKSS